MFGTNLAPEMPKMLKMEDCPFCGVSALWQKRYNRFNVGCSIGDCWADIESNHKYFDTLKDAIEFWNYRPITKNYQDGKKTDSINTWLIDQAAQCQAVQFKKNHRIGKEK